MQQSLSHLITQPTTADRHAFEQVSGTQIATNFTREQLILIADALLTAEVDYITKSEWFQASAYRAEPGSHRRTTADIAADKYFRKSCEARELSERVREMAGAQ